MNIHLLLIMLAFKEPVLDVQLLYIASVPIITLRGSNND
jgi:hypothetical protein